jgi:Fur family peroxide stress response transcriptional regulator
MGTSNFPFRLTRQRRAILEEVRAAGGHPRAAEIFMRVRQRQPRLAYATVYNTLHLLARHGLVQSFDFGEGASRFDPRTDRHDHLACRNCGQLVDVEVDLGQATQRLQQETGFRVEGYHVEFRGLCPTCQVGQERMSEHASSIADDHKGEDR